MCLKENSCLARERELKYFSGIIKWEATHDQEGILGLPWAGRVV